MIRLLEPVLSLEDVGVFGVRCVCCGRVVRSGVLSWWLSLSRSMVQSVCGTMRLNGECRVQQVDMAGWRRTEWVTEAGRVLFGLDGSRGDGRWIMGLLL